jgi:pyrimidine operon attenuation protein/uracil phosphoribosyltransferase
MAAEQTVIMDNSGIKRAITRISHEILERNKGLNDVVLIGIRSGGAYLAEEIGRVTEVIEGVKAPVGAVDITLYRDDVSGHLPHHAVGKTEIPFSLEGKRVVLVDDVLYTGRTIRAALDELVDFGRPRRVWLAVLVDRGGRELPIAADFAGVRLEVPEGDDVQVRWRENGAAEDSVVVREGRKP